MDFTAIDFETANNTRTSACSLGIALVENNKVIDTKHWLIRPEPLEFSSFNTAIHGITAADVKNAPTFSELWPDVAPYLDNNLVAAHNASFDVSVLRRTIACCDLRPPKISILCSYRLAQTVFPDLGSYRLNHISKYLDIPLEHHRADSDAAACANIICRVLKDKEIVAMDDLRSLASLSLGYWHYDDNYKPCQIAARAKHKKTDCDVSYDIKCLDEDFKDKAFVFTGTLLSMPRRKAFEVVARGGGITSNTVSHSTDFLVVGIQDYNRLKGASESTKMRKTKKLREQGAAIQIIGEDQFVNFIDDDLYNLCFSDNR